MRPGSLRLSGGISKDSQSAAESKCIWNWRTILSACLKNIHRHSESPIAAIDIARSDGEVRVEVEDQGKGISPDKKLELLSEGTPGVGIRGLRERLRQLGGTLEIASDGHRRGTVVVA